MMASLFSQLKLGSMGGLSLSNITGNNGTPTTATTAKSSVGSASGVAGGGGGGFGRVGGLSMAQVVLAAAQANAFQPLQDLSQRLVHDLGLPDASALVQYDAEMSSQLAHGYGSGPNGMQQQQQLGAAGAAGPYDKAPRTTGGMGMNSMAGLSLKKLLGPVASGSSKTSSKSLKSASMPGTISLASVC